jgi:hypothetical protein
MSPAKHTLMMNDHADFLAKVEARRAARMKTIDTWPKDRRECVHDYGFTVVNTLVSLGITETRHIRHIVNTVLNEFSPSRGTFSGQGIRTPYLEVKKREGSS